jgi:hypothetical protein
MMMTTTASDRLFNVFQKNQEFAVLPTTIGSPSRDSSRTRSLKTCPTCHHKVPRNWSFSYPNRDRTTTSRNQPTSDYDDELSPVRVITFRFCLTPTRDGQRLTSGSRLVCSSTSFWPSSASSLRMLYPTDTIPMECAPLAQRKRRHPAPLVIWFSPSLAYWLASSSSAITRVSESSPYINTSSKVSFCYSLECWQCHSLATGIVE